MIAPFACNISIQCFFLLLNNITKHIHHKTLWNFIFIILCIISFIWPQLSFSQTFYFKKYSVTEGLSQSQVNCIFEDSRGFLWIGTAGGGLCKYDGKKFETFDEKSGISGQIVTCITEDKKGNIWIGSTWGEVSKFDGKNFTNLTVKNGLLSNAINCIATDNENNVWIGTNNGLSIYDGKSFENKNEENGLLDNDIRAVHCDSEGIIWMATPKGLHRYDGKGFAKLTEENGLPFTNINLIAEDKTKNLWLYVNNTGIVILRRKKTKPLHLEPELYYKNDLFKDKFITSIAFNQDNIPFIVTKDNGVFKIDSTSYSIFDTKNGLPTNTIYAIHIDRTNNIWLGTLGYGLLKHTPSPFTSYANYKGMGIPSIFALLSDKKNNIWCGSGGEGIVVYNGDSTKNISTHNGLPNSKVRVLYEDKKGNIWIGSEGGLTKYDGKNFTTFTKENGLPSNHIRAICEDKNGKLWIGTYGEGIAVFNGVNFNLLGTKHGLSHLFIHYLFSDSKGNMWIGTGNGIFKYDEEGFTNYSTLNGLCNSYVGMIAEDSFGNIWFSTDRCVMKYDGIDFKSFTQKDGLSNNTIYLLIFDNEKNLWVGTNKGVDKISFSSYGQITGITNFSFSDGFTGIECNSRATCKDANGNLWFGTVDGVIKYNPTQNIPNTIPPLVHITNVRLFLNEVDWNKTQGNTTAWFHTPIEARLAHNKNHLTFDFCGIDFTQPEKIKYSYILEGFDNKWSAPTDIPFVTYSNLSYGNYTFKVRVINANKIYSVNEAKISFKIYAPFWKTWWFYTLAGILIIITVYRYEKYRIKKESEFKAYLETLVKEKTQQLVKEKEEKEILLKEIHHRVKNNLQVINSLISIQSGYTNDPRAIELFEECKNRIKSMALIHEKLYESKDLSNINVKDYINNLITYLIRTYQLEKNIIIELNLEEENFNIDTIIPLGLIINEIISNTLKYAFTAEKINCIITMQIKKTQNEFFEMVIGDNGVGMPRDKFDNNQSTLGIELIKILTEQLSGSVKFLEREGTFYQILFKEIKK
ncbi:MAG: hypothetical protein HND27_06180 [Bacteroidetes bacterium]|nr:hypothetical protein [Bacteroidota bacterium]NOG95350.1 hypothetical protein [Bacteroidota bacterium]GIK69636.1 MAG: hypothetical protein BroJett020_09310 [Bacteroidota bacterium]